MSNNDEFERMLNAARGTRAEANAQEQNRERALAALEAEALKARQRTLDLARYAAGQLVAHQVKPAVDLVAVQPQTYTRGLFGRKPDPVRYASVAQGWPVMNGRCGEGGSMYGTYNLQGILMTKDGDLIQYVGGHAAMVSSFRVAPPDGEVIVYRNGLLGADPKDDAVVTWGYRGGYGPDAHFADAPSPDRSTTPFPYWAHLGFGEDGLRKSSNHPDIENDMQQSIIRLTAQLLQDSRPTE